MQLRPERTKDRVAVRAVNEAAFESPAEADIVDALRDRAQPFISLVADDEGAVVGHIMFSPVALSGHPGLQLMGLAPMAVVPGRQREGIGSALVREGLKECVRTGIGAVVVLGHPEYYPRFGFSSASRFGIGCEFDVPDEAFMVLELEAGYLDGAEGIITYHEAFRETAMENEWTCGKGLAAHSPLPKKMAELTHAVAGILELHMEALDLSDELSRTEHAAYSELAAVHRRIAADLASTAERMAGYRDLPMGRHDEAAMSGPRPLQAFESFVRLERELVTLLQKRLDQDELMLGGMSEGGGSMAT